MAIVSKFPQPRGVDDGLDAVFANLRALHGAHALRRALRDVSVLAVDALFADLETLERSRPRTAAELDVEALGFLPDRYADRYDLLFARRFLLVLAEVTRRLAIDWSRPASVAEELALNLVLSYTEAVIDTDELDVDPTWRAAVEDLMFEDLDFEFLHADVDVLHAAVERLGATNLVFESWYTPFRERYAAPYIDHGQPS